jgi:FemAB-related protein (PEP-CTERM system-associated)
VNPLPATAQQSPGLASPPALVVRRATPADDAARDEFVATASSATFFHQAGWRRVIEATFGYEPRDLIALAGPRVVGVLPLMRCPAIFGVFGRPAWISMPFAVYGGPCGQTPEVELALLEAARRGAESERVGRLELRCIQAPPYPGLAASELYATFVKPLPSTPEAVLAEMPKKARAEVRKARDKHRLGLVEGIWYLDDLYRFFHLDKRALGSPGFPYGLFYHLRKEFGERVRVHLVHAGRKPLMAIMSFLWRDTLMAYYAGAAPGSNREYSVSNYAYMALQEWAVAEGFQRFDFGRSRKDSGAFDFKRHQGFEPLDLQYRYHLVRDRRLPSLTPSNPRTRLPREIWSRLPVGVTRRLSNLVAKYLP